MDINPVYLEPKSIKHISEQLDSDHPMVILKNFFTPKGYSVFHKLVTRLAYEKQIMWDKHHYHKGPIPKKLLYFVHTDKVREWFGKIIGFPVVQFDSGASYRFGWKDYTLLHDDMVLEPGVDIIFDFTEEFPVGCGGQIVYTEPGKESTTLPILPNQVIITKRGEGIHRFIQYVNHKSEGKKRFFVLLTLED